MEFGSYAPSPILGRTQVVRPDNVPCVLFLSEKGNCNRSDGINGAIVQFIDIENIHSAWF